MATAKKIEIRSDRPRKIVATFLVTGVEEPLLQHNWRKTMTRGSKDPAPKDYGSKADQAEAVTYRLSDRPFPGQKSDQLYMLPTAFRGSMLNSKGGAKGIKIGKNAAANQIASGCNFRVDKFCPLFDPKTKKPIRTYAINEDRVRIQKNYILCYRPEIWPWACTFRVQIDERWITLEQFLRLFQRSGVVAGAGDNRPQSGTFYGKYEVEIEAIEVLEVFGEQDAIAEETEE